MITDKLPTPKHRTVYLQPNEIEMAKELGMGNISRGIRIALGYTYRETKDKPQELLDIAREINYNATQQ